MKKFVIFITIFLVGILLGQQKTQAQYSTQTISIPQNFTFEKNFRIGDSSYPDINYIQIFLDRDTRTIVANSGPGSANQSTSYFGPKTKDAVSRFQELFREEILVPAGLLSPTGYWGPLTMAQANKILRKDSSVLGTTISSTNPIDYSNASVDSTVDATTNLTDYTNSSNNPYYASTAIGTSSNNNNPSATSSSSDMGSYTNTTSGNSGNNSSSNNSSNGTTNTIDQTFGALGPGGGATVGGQIGSAAGGSAGGAAGGPAGSMTGSSVGGMAGSGIGAGLGSGLLSSGSLLGGGGNSSGNMGGGMGGGAGGGTGGTSGGASGGGASGDSSLKNFGGPIVLTIMCVCNNNASEQMVKINDVSNQQISLTYVPGQSTLYMNYNLMKSGTNVLGQYTSGGGTCMVGARPYCSSAGTMTGTITQVGTSQ